MDFPSPPDLCPPGNQLIKKTIPANLPGGGMGTGIFIQCGPASFRKKAATGNACYIYKEGTVGYFKNHLRDFGHPSIFGYKDVL